jgi:hypothetical protein
MTTEWLPPIDDPPRVWLDGHLVLANLTEEEVESGNRLGRMIDVNHHEDNGLPGLRASRPLLSGTSPQQAAALALRSSLLDHGVANVVSPFTGKVGGVSVELQIGKGPTANPWYNTHFIAHLNHHTAGPRSGLTPSLSVCKLGRSDLEGPLCNGYGGRDFVYRIITFGYANHPGLGGPATFGNNVVPKDNGRPYLWGTEFEHDGVTAWADEMVEWMARCNAGILDFLGVGPEAQGEHKDPWAPGRKSDRNIITRNGSIARTKAAWITKEDEDVANTTKELEDAAYAAITRYERERHATGQPTPQEAYQATDDVLKQVQSNGSQLSNMLRTLAALNDTLQSIQTTLARLTDAMAAVQANTAPSPTRSQEQQ